MHDPMTVAHEIKWPISFRKNSISGEKYYNPLLTIWHVDPEKDGTDNSCGWFKRAHHGDKNMLEKIRKDFAFEFQYWFNDAGYPELSTIAIAVDMYSKAAWAVFKYNRRKHRRFMRKYLYDIIHFAENHVDSLLPAITMKYGVESRNRGLSILLILFMVIFYEKQHLGISTPAGISIIGKFNSIPGNNLNGVILTSVACAGKEDLKDQQSVIGMELKYGILSVTIAE